MRTHQEIDQRSLALHRLIADKIKREPVLFEEAKKTLARWRVIVSPSSQPYLAAWEDLMKQGIDACLAVATEDSEWATALRQSSPLACVLPNSERLDFLKRWRLDHRPK